MKKYLPFFILCLPAVAFSQPNLIQTNASDESTKKRGELLEDVFLSSAFAPFQKTVQSIRIDTKLQEPRGKMSGKNIILSAGVSRDTEFVKLFTHELAHAIDMYFLTGVAMSDTSNDFYRVSWISPEVKRAGEKQSSFVSGYAAVNQYEDFAESFVFYVFHNQYFQDRALRDESLRQKYLFFAKVVFPNGEFAGTDFSLGTPPNYSWDTTKIPISLQKYLYFLHSSL